MSKGSSIEGRFADQVQKYQSGSDWYGPSGGYAAAGYDSRSVAVREFPDILLRDFAQAAYDQPPEFHGFSLVPGLSSKETSVYVDPRSRRAVVAVRGTASKSDLLTDYHVANGTVGSSARYHKTDASIEAARKALGGYTIAVTGHSLGGSLVHEWANKHVDTHAVSFNSGYAVPGYSQKRGMKTGADWTEYLNKRDVVSAGSYFRKRDRRSRYYDNGRSLFGAHKARPTVKSWRYSGL